MLELLENSAATSVTGVNMRAMRRGCGVSPVVDGQQLDP
jgi:hypothetical protein